MPTQKWIGRAKASLILILIIICIIFWRLTVLLFTFPSIQSNIMYIFNLLFTMDCLVNTKQQICYVDLYHLSGRSRFPHLPPYLVIQDFFFYIFLSKLYYTHYIVEFQVCHYYLCPISMVIGLWGNSLHQVQAQYSTVLYGSMTAHHKQLLHY